MTCHSWASHRQWHQGHLPLAPPPTSFTGRPPQQGRLRTSTYHTHSGHQAHWKVISRECLQLPSISQPALLLLSATICWSFHGHASHTVMVYTLRDQLVCEFEGSGSDPGKFSAPYIWDIYVLMTVEQCTYVGDCGNRHVQVVSL